MKIVMTLLVRDNEDILRENLEYHLSRGVDFVIATDHRSCDSSPEILRSYEKEGKLEMIHERDDDISDSAKWVTRMSQLASTKHGADWVINNDTDEFWWPESGTIKDVLSQVPLSVGVVKYPREQFVLRPQTNNSLFWESMTVRQSKPTNALGRALPGKSCHRGSSAAKVSPGNHDATIDMGDKIEAQAIRIFHFPWRSWSQFSGKMQILRALPTIPWPTWREMDARGRSTSFESYYNDILVTEERLSKGLKSGELLEDFRFRDCMQNLNL